MRILQVNKFNYLKGGADKYFLELTEELKKAGHEVAKFSMDHKDNLIDENQGYFVSNVDFNNGNLWQKLRAAGRIFWSFEAARKFEALIKDFKPEVVHIHNIYHQISPSILRVAKRHGLPIVMHLHDYKLLCPNYKMYNSSGICEKCRGGKYYHCALNRCLKQSLAKSLLASLEMYLHHTFLKIYERSIDQYIAPSEFVRTKAIEWGVPTDKLVTQSYFIRTEEFVPNFEIGKYLLYFGRLSEEKGIKTLVRAYAGLRAANLPLKIVGSGPIYGELKDLIQELGLTENVALTGPKQGEELKKIISGSYAVIVPSEWHEVTGLVNLEAGLCGKPLVVARSGGIPEAVMEPETALTFEPGNEADLVEKLREIVDRPDLARKMGENGHEFVLANFSSKNHIKRLEEVYKNLLANK